MRLCDAEADRQAEAGPARVRLVVKNGLEDALEHDPGDPRPVVAHRRDHVTAVAVDLDPTLPPFGIACRAFAIRLRKICFSWFGLALTSAPESP